jgi:hypothetical protein
MRETFLIGFILYRGFRGLLFMCPSFDDTGQKLIILL